MRNGHVFPILMFENTGASQLIRISLKSSFISVIQLKLWNSCINKFSAHRLKSLVLLIVMILAHIYLEYGDMPIS